LTFSRSRSIPTSHSATISGPPPNCYGPPKPDRYGWRSDSSSLLDDSAHELQREKKWISMISRWSEFRTHRRQTLENRIRKGIPDRIRGKAWTLIIDFHPPPNAPSIDSLITQGPPRSLRVIEADVPRTMPGHIMFESPILRESLQRVLTAYTNFESELGYVQGMGFLAAMLLSYLDEEQTFWCFVGLMNGPIHKHKRLFQNQFQGLNDLNKVWDLIIEVKFPQIAANFKKIDLAPIVYTTGWWLGAFMGFDLQSELRMRVFDRFLEFGYRALLSFGLVVLVKGKQVLETAGSLECLGLLQNPGQSEKIGDWKAVLIAYDKHWINQKEYNHYFKKAGLEVFI
jgi:hypothetical protein